MRGAAISAGVANGGAGVAGLIGELTLDSGGTNG
jgi:hypothetical protein